MRAALWVFGQFHNQVCGVKGQGMWQKPEDIPAAGDWHAKSVFNLHCHIRWAKASVQALGTCRIGVVTDARDRTPRGKVVPPADRVGCRRGGCILGWVLGLVWGLVPGGGGGGAGPCMRPPPHLLRLFET